MPTSSSLVTNLPADFNTFGQGVDTSLQDLLGGTTGQVLSKTSGTNMDFTWVTPTDQTPLTTKGDIFAFSTVDARLPAGANETRLVADSAQTLGLKYVADTTNYAIAAKGDLLAGTAADTLQALSVGTNGQYLQADSTAATGLKWATNAASGMTLISRQTFSSVATTTTTFDGVFSSTYKTYLIVIESLYAATAANDLYFQYRVGSTTTAGSAYLWNNFILLSNATSALVGANNTSQIQLSRNCGAAAYPGSGEFWVNKVGNASEAPKLWGFYAEDNSEEAELVNGSQKTGATYTGFILSSSSSNITGTVAVYGLATS